MMMTATNPFPWLTLLTFVPVAGALALACVPARRQALARSVALLVALGELLLVLLLLHHFDSASGAMQLVERRAWIPALGVEYFVGVDGLGILMLLLTAIVVPMGILASKKINERARLYFALLLPRVRVRPTNGSGRKQAASSPPSTKTNGRS